jgi:hypothetical protein
MTRFGVQERLREGLHTRKLHHFITPIKEVWKINRIQPQLVFPSEVSPWGRIHVARTRGQAVSGSIHGFCPWREVVWEDLYSSINIIHPRA